MQSDHVLPFTTLGRPIKRSHIPIHKSERGYDSIRKAWSWSQMKILWLIGPLPCIAVLHRWMEDRHPQSYEYDLWAHYGYIATDTNDDNGDCFVAQMYRDHSLDTPVVLETSGLVSRFGFEGYTWYNNRFVMLYVMLFINPSAASVSFLCYTTCGGDYLS